MRQAARQMSDPLFEHAEQSVCQADLVHEAADEEEGRKCEHVEVRQGVRRLLGKHDEGLVVENDKLEGGCHHGIGDRDFQKDQDDKRQEIYGKMRIKINQGRHLLLFPPGHRCFHPRSPETRSSCRRT